MDQQFCSHKIFLPAWPRKWDITALDPARRSEDTCTLDNPLEPRTPIYARFLDFLESQFYESDYQRVIYWSLIGHVKCRVGAESSGVPKDLRMTFSQLALLILNDILPRIAFDDTVVMIHPDHGTRRKGKPNHVSINDGWLWVRHPNLPEGKIHNRRITWADYRRMILDVFSLDELRGNNNGVSVLLP